MYHCQGVDVKIVCHFTVSCTGSALRVREDLNYQDYYIPGSSKNKYIKNYCKHFEFLVFF